MKKRGVLTSFMLLLCAAGLAQVIFTGSDQRWEITGIDLEPQYMAISCDITILSKKAGCFDAHEYDKDASILIYGQFGRLKLIKSVFTGDYEPWYNYGVQWNYFEKRNLGKVAHAVFYFPRIPAGISSFNWYFDGGEADESAESDRYHCPIFDVRDIHINNPNTTRQTYWTEQKLKDYWADQHTQPIEGIYNFVSTDNIHFWGENRHKIAIKKDGSGYIVIYIKGCNDVVWSEGEEKGFISPTATKGLYSVDAWYQDNKMPATADFYLLYDKGGLELIDSKSGVTTSFLKYYPSVDLDEASINEISTTPTATTDWKWSGTGFFINEKGYLATNYHVVEHAQVLQVEFSQKGVKYAYKAEVVVTDPKNDLAILKIKDPAFQTLPQIPYIFDAKTEDVGTEVFALGYPMSNILGQEIKFSDGKISAKTGIQGDIRLYQISVPINHGNSGGPLFDSNGHLIGVTSSGMDKGEYGEVNYAIKVAYLKNLIEVIPEHIELPHYTPIMALSLTEKIKILSDFIPQILAK